MPAEVTILHRVGRSEHALDYYEIDDQGALAIIKDGQLVALYPQGAWHALYPVARKGGSASDAGR